MVEFLVSGFSPAQPLPNYYGTLENESADGPFLTVAHCVCCANEYIFNYFCTNF